MNNNEPTINDIVKIIKTVILVLIYITLWNIPYINILFAIYHVACIYVIIHQVWNNLKKHTTRPIRRILIQNK